MSQIDMCGVMVLERINANNCYEQQNWLGLEVLTVVLMKKFSSGVHRLSRK
jgi:hypothetical protein